MQMLVGLSVKLLEINRNRTEINNNFEKLTETEISITEQL